VTARTDMYELMPRIYRIRDAQLGYPLRQLMAVLSRDYERLVDKVEAQYDDWFIETCSPAVIARIARLVGIDASSLAGDADVDRAAVADALSLNAAKGTVAALEQVVIDITGWPMRVVEVANSLATTAAVGGPPQPTSIVPDLRHATPAVAGDIIAGQLTDVRDMGSARTPGRGHATSVLVQLWRMRADTAVGAPAADIGPSRCTFDPLGDDVALVIAPLSRPPGRSVDADLDVPARITRQALARHLPDYYGRDRSILVSLDGRDVPADEIVVGDLSQWWWRRGGRSARAERRYMVIDPELGRLLLPRPKHDAEPRPDVRVTYSRLVTGGPGSSHQQSGDPSISAERLLVERTGHNASTHRTIAAAWRAWTHKRTESHGTGSHVVIEIADDGVYTDPLELDLYAGEHLTICAAAGRQPNLIGLRDGDVVPILIRGHAQTRPGAGGAPSPHPAAPAVTLRGLRVRWRAVHLVGTLGRVEVSRCTLTPPTGEQDWSEDASETLPALSVHSATASVSIESSLCGPIRIVNRTPDDAAGDEEPARRARDPLGHDPVHLTITDSILDCGFPPEMVSVDAPLAVFGPEREPALATLTLLRSTVFGSVSTLVVDRVEDALVIGALECTHRQHGVVRHSYFRWPSRTPRRADCPDDGSLSLAFDSREFAAPAYGRLDLTAPEEIRYGAHDGAELGALHDLFGFTRIQRLRQRLASMTPAGVDLDLRFPT
jgi:Phage tail protein (Tail_P2_I)